MPTALADKSIILETTVPGRPAVADVLHEHIEEVANLSVQWRKLIFSPDVPLRNLRRHLQRIEAHLDGLRVGGPASVSISLEMLEQDDPWLVYAAALTWIEISHPGLSALCERLQKTPPGLWRAWKEAFRKSSPEVVSRLFSQVKFEALPAEMVPIAADILGWHGFLQPHSAARLAAEKDSQVRQAVARQALQPELIARLLEDENLATRRCALWSMLRQNPAAGMSRCRQMVSNQQPDAFAIRLVGLFGDVSDEPKLLSLLRQKSIAPVALTALRDLGRPGSAEPLLQLIESDDADLALVAKEVFESLVGRIPESTPEKLIPAGISNARFHWQEVQKNLDLSKRVLHGRAFPWQGNPADEPMLWIWRRTLVPVQPEMVWLSREVPDGFFADQLTDESIPGE